MGGIQDGLQPVLQLAGDTSENRVAVVHLADNQYTNQGQQGVSRRSSAFTDATTSAGATAENSRNTHPTGAGVKDGGSMSAVAARTPATLLSKKLCRSDALISVDSGTRHGHAAYRRTAIGGPAATARHRRVWTRTQNASCEAVRSTGVVKRATL